MNQVIHGDSLDVLRQMDDNSIDAIVTDPPAGIAFMGKEWDRDKGGRDQWVAWMAEVAAECLRVIKPGGHALVWAIPRTSHWTGMAWEQAGWEPRDKVYHLFGSGFPKSHNGPWGGTALKPAVEEWWLFRKPLCGTVAANVLQWGTGALNIDACRVGTEDVLSFGSRQIGDGIKYNKCEPTTEGVQHPSGRWPANLVHDGSEEVVGRFPTTSSSTARVGRRSGKQSGTYGEFNGQQDVVMGHDDAGGSAARFFAQISEHPVNLFFERAKTIISAWRPSGLEASCCENASTAEQSSSLSNEHVGSVLSAAAILASRGASVLSGLRVRSTIETESELSAISETLIATILSTENGCWPAQSHDVQTPNGCLVRCAETSEQTGTMTTTISLPRFDGSVAAVIFDITLSSMAAGEADSADRFKYCAKASRRERDAGLEDVRNHHATVKPIALMEWLIKLVTPPGGVVLDPFAGSGTTGCAAARLGVRSILIEREAEYVEIARRRVAYWSAELDAAAD